MKKYVRKLFCKDIQELEDAFQAFQRKLTPEYCTKYINKLKEVR
jgi:hypothetical protein